MSKNKEKSFHDDRPVWISVRKNPPGYHPNTEYVSNNIIKMKYICTELL